MSTRAAEIARKVAIEAMRDVDTPPEDEFMSIMRQVDPDPINVLATHPDIDTASLVRSARLARFVDRGCRHLPEKSWQAENAMILSEIVSKLRRRYERHLQIMFPKTGFSGGRTVPCLISQKETER